MTSIVSARAPLLAMHGAKSMSCNSCAFGRLTDVVVRQSPPLPYNHNEYLKRAAATCVLVPIPCVSHSRYFTWVWSPQCHILPCTWQVTFLCFLFRVLLSGLRGGNTLSLRGVNTLSQRGKHSLRGVNTLSEG